MKTYTVSWTGYAFRFRGAEILSAKQLWATIQPYLNDPELYIKFDTASLKKL